MGEEDVVRDGVTQVGYCVRGFRVESGVEVGAFRSRLILVNGVA